MQRPGTDTGSLGPWWGREEQTESMSVALMTESGVSHNSRILASKGNPVSSVQAGSNRNMSSALVIRATVG